MQKAEAESLMADGRRATTTRGFEAAPSSSGGRSPWHGTFDGHWRLEAAPVVTARHHTHGRRPSCPRAAAAAITGSCGVRNLLGLLTSAEALLQQGAARRDGWPAYASSSAAPRIRRLPVHRVAGAAAAVTYTAADMCTAGVRPADGARGALPHIGPAVVVGDGILGNREHVHRPGQFQRATVCGGSGGGGSRAARRALHAVLIQARQAVREGAARHTTHGHELLQQARRRQRRELVEVAAVDVGRCHATPAASCTAGGGLGDPTHAAKHQVAVSSHHGLDQTP